MTRPPFARLAALGVALVVVAGTIGSASAQFYTPIRFRNEGRGVLVTEKLVVHPGVSIEGRYDSNVLQNETDVRDAPYLRLIGHFDIATRSPQRMTYGDGRQAPQKVAFRLQSAFGYREYLSNDEAITNQRGLEIDAGLELRLAPSRWFSFEVQDNYLRAVTTRNSAIASVAGGGAPVSLSSGTLTRDSNRLDLRAVITPGGGRLSLTAAYALWIDAYEDQAFKLNNRLYNEASLQAKYRLLPKTAVLIEAIQRFYNYLETQPALFGNVDSMPLRLYAGLTGLVTPRLSTVLKVGYGNAFYESGTSFNSVLAKAEVAYRLMPMARVQLGYERLFDDSPYGNYLTDHKVYAGYDHVIGRRVVLHADADFKRREYQGFERFTPRPPAISANLLTVALGLDYQMQDWAYIGVGYDLQLQDLKRSGADNPGGFLGIVDFARHQFYARVGVSY
ncbi:MAG: outer membrane beta-barrel protein [Proteobacteria bacterium]|nr:outer membrane beta-barrel protein [Pseudomonadota bacterium]